MLICQLGSVDEHELLRADVDAIHVREPALRRALRTVHDDAVSAPGVFDEYLGGPNVKDRVAPRDEGVGNSKVATRAATNRELTLRKLQVGIAISETKP